MVAPPERGVRGAQPPRKKKRGHECSNRAGEMEGLYEIERTILGKNKKTSTYSNGFRGPVSLTNP